MKHIRRFNESAERFSLSMEDVRNLKHNLDYREKDSFMKNYGWNEDTKLEAEHRECQGTWEGKEVAVYGLREKHELGWAVAIDGKIEYLIGIYEPYSCSINAKRGLITCIGHEEIIKLWLDDGEFESEYTR